MRRRTFLFGSVSTLGGVGLLAGSGAFSRTESQREVTIEVVGDEDAYLYLKYPVEKKDGETYDPVEEKFEFDCEGRLGIMLTNHFKEDLGQVDITFDTGSEHIVVVDQHVPSSLPLGESKVATFDLACLDGSEELANASFVVTVVGSDTRTEVQRTKEITLACDCEVASVSWVSFCGVNLYENDFQDVQATVEDAEAGSVHLSWTWNVDDKQTRADRLERVVLFDGSFGNYHETNMWDFPAEHYPAFTDHEEVSVNLTVGEDSKAGEGVDWGNDERYHPSRPCPDDECGPKYESSDGEFEADGHQREC